MLLAPLTLQGDEVLSFTHEHYVRRSYHCFIDTVGQANRG